MRMASEFRAPPCAVWASSAHGLATRCRAGKLRPRLLREWSRGRALPPALLRGLRARVWRCRGARRGGAGGQ